MTSRLLSQSWFRRTSVVLLIGVFLLTGQIVGAGLFCRSDPTVVLSNGVIMDFGANISTLPWNVQEVHYELHVPVGVTRLVSIHTPTWIGTVESFTFHADQPPGQYSVSAVIETQQDNVSVNLDATLVSAALANIHLGVYGASGFEGQLLTILLNI